MGCQASVTKLKSLNELFDLQELKRVLRETKRYSAPGADYEILQKLPKCSIKVVLKLNNQICINDDFPVATLNSSLLPVLKHGKDPENPASYINQSVSPQHSANYYKNDYKSFKILVEKRKMLN